MPKDVRTSEGESQARGVWSLGRCGGALQPEEIAMVQTFQIDIAAQHDVRLTRKEVERAIEAAIRRKTQPGIIMVQAEEVYMYGGASVK
jgi:hypothetical protein